MKSVRLLVLAVVLASYGSVACGVKLPPITVVIPPPTPVEPQEPTPPPPPSDRATLGVEVLNADGAPVSGIVVSLHTDEQATTNADGYVEFHDILRGARHVVVHHGLADHEPHAFDAPVDKAENVERVRLVRSAPVQPPPSEFQNLNVVVVDADTKRPIAGAQVDNQTIGETRMTDGGGFANFGVRGAVTLSVSAADYASESRGVSPGDVRFELSSTKPKPVELHGVPVGLGGRAPSNQPLPSYGLDLLRQLAAKNVAALNASCQDHGGNWRFMDMAVDLLRTYDSRFGYNGKRGNANDPSKDAIAYHWGDGPDGNSTDVYIVDIIGGHCGPVPSPTWNDVTKQTLDAGTIGRWVSRGRF